MKDIKLVKFVDGTEVIAEILQNDENLVRLKNPIRIVIMPPDRKGENPKVGFAEWLPYVKDKEFEIVKSHVLIVVEPVNVMVDQHKSIFSGISMPIKQDLIIKP